MSHTKNVGVWLLEPAFTHGQLYVAASMVEDPQHNKFAMNKTANRKTRSVVYNVILFTGEVVFTPTEVTSTCSLLHSDQLMDAVEE